MCLLPDKPADVKLLPSNQSYTVIETKSVGPITCTADCTPNCTMSWNGPYIPDSTTSVLTLQNINRTQAGNYSCTASNKLGSEKSVTVTVIVNCKCR